MMKRERNPAFRLGRKPRLVTISKLLIPDPWIGSEHINARGFLNETCMRLELTALGFLICQTTGPKSPVSSHQSCFDSSTNAMGMGYPLLE